MSNPTQATIEVAFRHAYPEPDGFFWKFGEEPDRDAMHILLHTSLYSRGIIPGTDLVRSSESIANTLELTSLEVCKEMLRLMEEHTEKLKSMMHDKYGWQEES